MNNESEKKLNKKYSHECTNKYISAFVAKKYK
jgi:hypothetical protein